jgi:predicted nucleotidyltransferase
LGGGETGILSGMKLSLEELKEKLAGFFRMKEEVSLAYLFGSSLQGKSGKDHDIDIGLFLNPRLYESLDEGNPYGYKAEMIVELMNLLKYDLIDLVILNKCTPVLAYQVIHHGTLLFARSEKTRIQFELTSLKRHADTKHLRNIKRVYSGKRIEKGLSAYD